MAFFGHLPQKAAILPDFFSEQPLIDLVEELRRDLPNVKHRQDSGAVVMQQALSPERVLAVLDEEVTSPDGSISASTKAPSTPAVANADKTDKTTSSR